MIIEHCIGDPILSGFDETKYLATIIPHRVTYLDKRSDILCQRRSFEMRRETCLADRNIRGTANGKGIVIAFDVKAVTVERNLAIGTEVVTFHHFHACMRRHGNQQVIYGFGHSLLITTFSLPSTCFILNRVS